MSLRNGRSYLAIPGPSVTPDRVLRAMHQPAPNIYSGSLVDLTASLIPDLKTVARTNGHVAIYIANGHGAWEAALANVAAPGEKVLVLATGRFGHGWAEMAERMGIHAEILEFGLDTPVDPAKVETRLKQPDAAGFKAVMVTHVDTSTSILNDVAAVRAALDAAGYEGLLMADCIASLGCDRFEMDAWGVDVMVAACQKGLMTPPGVSFVFFNEKAAEVRRAMPLVSIYWDWTNRGNPEEFYQYFAGTAPTHHLFGLREALNMIVHEEGLDAVFNRHTRIAEAVWTAMEVWGDGGPMTLNVEDRKDRSHAVTAARLTGPNGTALRDWTEQNMGVTLGIGLGMAHSGDPAWHRHFRIVHMGHVNGQMIFGVLGSIEAGLTALDIPHGEGALGAAAKVLAAS
ncbi:septum site-determining protein [Actibacterium mucosum KCTC 23349]|uniref:Septum site-determining protein n=1 Tax=Actibacterium mucosum KCTC 23349 TaxID=1454373 RepID=A0A037ZH49_9RHOB|nr:aminotransferase class V-fold PLP-dependent enzyme [Actibacterium mucosum]KAJ54150.1 septum site-determining protein [Actibacterium mucosum KCTC 23349]